MNLKSGEIRLFWKKIHETFRQKFRAFSIGKRLQLALRITINVKADWRNFSVLSPNPGVDKREILLIIQLRQPFYKLLYVDFAKLIETAESSVVEVVEHPHLPTNIPWNWVAELENQILLLHRTIWGGACVVRFGSKAQLLLFCGFWRGGRPTSTRNITSARETVHSNSSLTVATLHTDKW